MNEDLGGNMAQGLQHAGHGGRRVPRRRILENEAPVLAAIAALLSAWLALSFAIG